METAQDTIASAFATSSLVPNMADVQHEPLYDTVTYAAGNTINETTSALFTNVGPASGKTFAQTNMSQSQRLPAPEQFSIFSIRVRWGEAALRADVNSVINGFAYEFWANQKCYNRAPLWYYAAGGGLWTTSNVAGDFVYTNGFPDRRGMHQLALNFVIENQMTFFARLTGTALVLTAAVAGGQGFIVQNVLDGLHARGVS